MALVPWMVYTVAVGLLLTCAGWALDRGLGRVRVPTRWIWALALLGGLVLPLAALVPTGTQSEAAVLHAIVSGAVQTSAETEASLAADSRRYRTWAAASILLATLVQPVEAVLGRVSRAVPSAPGVERAILILWGLSSSALILLHLLARVRLARRAGSWGRATLRGRSVLVSRRLGPAVAGSLRPAIVLPTWATSLGSESLEMVLMHEEEHLRARDPLLLAAALVPVLLMPWSPGTWLQLRALRGAVEVDCDRRVLARGAAPARYGSMLVRLREAGGATGLATPALLGTARLLTRRLEAMKTRKLTSALPVTFGGGLLAATLFAVACDAEPPTPPPLDPAPNAIGSEEEGTAEIILRGDGPRVILRDPASDPTGSRPLIVVDGVIVSSVFDLGTLEIESIEVIRGGAAASLFGARAADGVIRIVTTREGTERSSDPDSQSAVPTFTPYEVAPEVLNRQEVQRALEREYPPHLRDAGIGGIVVLHVHIDEEGSVRDALPAESSGHPEIDAAAVRVARAFQFTPARNHGQAVAVWVQIPVQFAAR